jgi:hypothetical protein
MATQTMPERCESTRLAMMAVARKNKEIRLKTTTYSWKVQLVDQE